MTTDDLWATARAHLDDAATDLALAEEDAQNPGLPEHARWQQDTARTHALIGHGYAALAAAGIPDDGPGTLAAHIIATLDEISGGPEDAHRAADQALLAMVPPTVAAAYQRARNRIGFWYA